MNNKRKSSGIIIIGDEILSGKTLDTNSNFICKELSKRGVDTKEISVVGDLETKIINKVREFSDKFDYVFTTGGIGPTHDDITPKSIAKAFNKKLSINKKAKKYLENHYDKKELTKARLKMAFIPETSELILNPVSLAPGFFLKNIYVFPGVPKILEAMFYEFVDKLLEKNTLPQINISTTLSEGVIGEYLAKIQNENMQITIGSYPYFKHNLFGVSLVLKGQNKLLLEKVSHLIFNYLKKLNGKPKYF